MKRRIWLMILIPLVAVLLMNAVAVGTMQTAFAEEVTEEEEESTVPEEIQKAAKKVQDTVNALPAANKIKLSDQAALQNATTLLEDFEGNKDFEKDYPNHKALVKDARDALYERWQRFNDLWNESSAASEAESKKESEEASKKESEEASKKASEEESRSIEESESVSKSESESASISESESIEESIKESEEEAKRVFVDDYEVFWNVKGVKAPEGFFEDEDTETFDKPVGAFFSTAFQEYVYYAEKNEKKGYYVYNRMKDSLIPFVTFTGTEGRRYIVSAPNSARDLPPAVRRETKVDVGTLSAGTTIVPGFTAVDKNGEPIVLLYLISDKAKGSYFVYSNEGGSITLTPYDEDSEEETEEETTEEETTEESTEEETTEEETTEEEKKSSGSGTLKNYLIWLIIIGVIVVLLIVAIIVVSRMSHRQQQEEDELDLDNNLFEHTKAPEEFDSSYTPKPAGSVEPFETSFENAFPEEMNVRKEGLDAEMEEAFPNYTAAATTTAAAAPADIDEQEAALKAPTERLPEIPDDKATATIAAAAAAAAAAAVAATAKAANAEPAKEEAPKAENAEPEIPAEAVPEVPEETTPEIPVDATPEAPLEAEPVIPEIPVPEAAAFAPEFTPEQTEQMNVEETIRKAEETEVPKEAEEAKRKAKYKKVLDESDFEVINFDD